MTPCSPFHAAFLEWLGHHPEIRDRLIPIEADASEGDGLSQSYRISGVHPAIRLRCHSTEIWVAAYWEGEC